MYQECSHCCDEPEHVVLRPLGLAFMRDVKTFGSVARKALVSRV